MKEQKGRSSNSDDNERSFLGVERILHLKNGRKVRKISLRLYFPTYSSERRCWQTSVDCELFGKEIRTISGGEDAFQSLLLGLRVIKTVTDGEIEQGRKLYWLCEGDECDWTGIMSFAKDGSKPDFLE